MAMDSGDSLRETVKRKDGDGEQEGSEDMKDKKSKESAFGSRISESFKSID